LAVAAFFLFTQATSSRAAPLSHSTGNEPATATDLSLAATQADPIITGTVPQVGPKIALLGSLEFRTERTPYQSAWSSLLSRMSKETALYAACRNGSSNCPPRMQRWQKLIQSVRSVSRLQQLKRLNPAINGMASYADDSAIYGTRDYWASPGEFLKGRADCEDYAVVKYFSLVQLGFAASQLRIVIVKDTKRRVLHAVLTVELDRKVYVLDSLQSQPVEEQFVLKYEPISSINTQGRWAHVVTPQIRSRFLAELNAAPSAELNGSPALEDRAEAVRPTKASKPVIDSRLDSPHFVHAHFA
jgi:predicted transglutaminase-like cysteine proteinase